jgi:phage tail sheath protein FI
VYGARTLSSDDSWRYVSVRRLLMFVEESLGEGLQWVVFEPNDEHLWARVIQSVSSFLTRVWHDGALLGAKVEEAFFVRCDGSTMTEDDFTNGRLVLEVGLAPTRPAEFVIIRVGQWLGGSSVAEL